jgi:hypothetical protein
MARINKIGQLAAVGATGNNTHAGVAIPPDIDVVSAEFEITAVGGTPTVTYKLQGTMDGSDVTDTLADWFDLATLPNDSATEAVPATKTAVGVYQLVADLRRRFARRVRLVTSANTNVTYESELWGAVDV